MDYGADSAWPAFGCLSRLPPKKLQSEHSAVGLAAPGAGLCRRRGIRRPGDGGAQLRQYWMAPANGHHLRLLPAQVQKDGGGQVGELLLVELRGFDTLGEITLLTGIVRHWTVYALLHAHHRHARHRAGHAQFADQAR